jgi:starch phosphorylase
VPTFYERGRGGLPRSWLNMMKASIGSLCQFFNTHRMVGEYTRRFYMPVSKHFQQFTSDGMEKATNLAGWKSSIRESWPEVKVLKVTAPEVDEIPINEEFEVKAQVFLGKLTPDDVKTELYLGPVSPNGEMLNPHISRMDMVEAGPGNVYHYEGIALACCSSGLYGYTVRVLPSHKDLKSAFLPGLITWA